MTTSALADTEVRICEDQIEVKVVAGWELSDLKAQRQAENELVEALAGVITQEDRQANRRLRRHVKELCRDEAAQQELSIERRPRAVGDQMRASIRLTLPRQLVERGRADWDLTLLRQRMLLHGLALSTPLLIAVLIASFIALDRYTLGDRRAVLAGAYLSISCTIAAAAWLVVFG